MTIDGSATSIHDNCTTYKDWLATHRNLDGFFKTLVYGLHASGSSPIHILAPLTKETVSTNNEGDKNYGGKGTIAILDNEGTIIETIQEAESESESDEPEEDAGDGGIVNYAPRLRF